MIHDGPRSVLISSMGWVDRNSLWTFDVLQGREARLTLGSGARYLSVHTRGGDLFTVAHHFDGARFEVTVHRFAQPADMLAKAVVSRDGLSLEGTRAVWKDVPGLYAEYLAFEPWKDFTLVRILPDEERIQLQRFAWYDDTYDKGYQGIVGVVQLPGEQQALVSVQRSSELVVHDLVTGEGRGSVRLAGRLGNPHLFFRHRVEEVWATDYDTVVVLDRRTLAATRSVQLQDAAAGVRQIIGDLDFDEEETLCAVARPFSGDVVAVDPSSLKVRWRATLGGQPLEVAVLPDRRIVSRDWKTGRRLEGELRPQR